MLDQIVETAAAMDFFQRTSAGGLAAEAAWGVHALSPAAAVVAGLAAGSALALGSVPMSLGPRALLVTSYRTIQLFAPCSGDTAVSLGGQAVDGPRGASLTRAAGAWAPSSVSEQPVRWHYRTLPRLGRDQPSGSGADTDTAARADLSGPSLAASGESLSQSLALRLSGEAGTAASAFPWELAASLWRRAAGDSAAAVPPSSAADEGFAKQVRLRDLEPLETASLL
jgi:hypothetical protein